MTTPIVLPWPLRSGLEAATRALFGLGDQSSADFLRPAGEAALVSPDSVSWRVFKNPLSLPNTRFARTDGAIRRGSDAQQCLRTAQLGACKERPSRAKREFALHYNRRHISQEFVEGALR